MVEAVVSVDEKSVWTVNILAEWRFSIKEDEGSDGDRVPENLSLKLIQTGHELNP